MLRRMPARVGEAPLPGPRHGEGGATSDAAAAGELDCPATCPGELAVACANITRVETIFTTLVEQVPADLYALHETKVPPARQPGIIERLNRAGLYTLLGPIDAEAKVPAAGVGVAAFKPRPVADI